MFLAIRSWALVGAAVSVAALAPAHAQQQPAPDTGPRVGEMAPDFTVSGSTRYGRLAEPVTLSKLRGNTVVLAFFFKARTKG